MMNIPSGKTAKNHQKDGADPEMCLLRFRVFSHLLSPAKQGHADPEVLEGHGAVREVGGPAGLRSLRSSGAWSLSPFCPPIK